LRYGSLTSFTLNHIRIETKSGLPGRTNTKLEVTRSQGQQQ